MRIFLTQPIGDEAVERLRSLGELEVNPDPSRPVPRERLIEAVRRCDVLVCLLHDRIDAEVLDAAPDLRLIASGAVHPSNIDLAAASARRIPVTVIPNLVAEATADLQWALLMAVARRIPEADRKLRQGLFPGAQSLYFVGGDISGRTLGTVGLGAIGKLVARRAQAFRMRVLYTKRSRLSPSEEAELNVEYRSLDDLMRESDYVVINASLHEGTRRLVGAPQLARMRPHAYLVNTSRGPILDQAALIEALRSGRIAGAALDVFEAEPQVPPELAAFDNVVLTPHIGSAARGTRARIAAVVGDNVAAFLSGRVPPNLYNPEVLAGGASAGATA